MTEGEQASNTAKSEELLSLEEAVRFLGVSRPTIYRMLSAGDLKGLRVGRQWRFSKDDLMTHMARTEATLGPRAQADAEAESGFFAQEAANLGLAMEEVDADAASPDAAAVVRLCSAMVRLALAMRASDLHLEPRRSGGEECALVRYRIDGELHVARRMPRRLLEPVVDRLKSMAGLDVGERRLPQSGRIPIDFGGAEYELRAATLPVFGGEAMTLRVLVRDVQVPDLGRLNLSDGLRARLDALLHCPNGILLVSGPTGSGKTTTLYAALQSISGDGVKTMTVEDPVELVLPNATQVAVNPRGGITIASALRAVMQHDPDVIMLADVTDQETAQAAVQIAMNGHLVLCQLHADSAAGAIDRFVSLCSDPYYPAGALIGALNQRLVRRVCGQCGAEAEATQPAAVRLVEVAGTADDLAAGWRRGFGCPACRATGYRGRAALYELITVDRELAAAIRSQASAEELAAAARAQGQENLAIDGVRKAAAGLTTPEEVLRVLGIAV
ncbi:MAG: GspE/PulE family protein [Armatimonadetes bacterium]|nr:GspE/PulE family protein [Armatimonadota bacterium]